MPAPERDPRAVVASPLLRSAAPAFTLLMVLAVTAPGTLASSDAVTGSLASPRAAACGCVLLAAALLLARAVRDRRRWLRDVEAAEADPGHPMWAHPESGRFLNGRLQLLRTTRVDLLRAQTCALAAVPLWLFTGAYGMGAGLLLAALVAGTVALGGIVVEFGAAVSDAGACADRARAAAQVGLDNVPAAALFCPAAPVLLARLGLDEHDTRADDSTGTAAGDVLEVARRLAGEPGDSTRTLVEVVDVARAIVAPAT